jgi:hypothetical protein
MNNIDIYEYYDGYEEFHTKRNLVRYIVIGDMDNSKVICYVHNIGYISKISNRIHNKAWIIKERHGSYTDLKTFVKKALEYERSCKSKKVLECKIQNLIENREHINKQYKIMKPGIVSSSSTDFIGSSIILQYGDDDYVEKYIKIIKDFLRQVEIVEEFLAKD